MTFAPPTSPTQCPHCGRAVPLAALETCPICKGELRSPGDLGASLIEHMKGVLGGVAGDAAPKRTR
jgi:hypothetical protein